MPNIPDDIRINAFKYVEENKISELYELIAENPGLINERSKRDNGTLFMRACQYLQKDIIALLINEGADLEATNNHGKNGIMQLLYRHEPKIEDVKRHDKKALEILELLKDKKISINCFTAKDANGDTPLIEVARAALPQSTDFMIELLQNQKILTSQLTHTNSKGENTLSAVLKAKFFHDTLIKQSIIVNNPNHIAQVVFKAATHVNSPTDEDKYQLISLLYTALVWCDETKAMELFGFLINSRLYYPKVESDCSFNNQKELKNEFACNPNGYKVYNSIYLDILKAFYVAGNIYFPDAVKWINSLTAIQDEDLGKNNSYGVILESNKQELLKIAKEIIMGAAIETPEQNIVCSEDTDVVLAKDLALQKVCFIIANKEKLSDSLELEMKNLFKFSYSEGQSLSYDFNNNLIKYLVKYYGNYETLQEAINTPNSPISKIITDSKIVLNLHNIKNDFMLDVDIVTNELEKLLNPILQDVLPRNVFLDLVDNKKEMEVTQDTYKFIRDNLKFFDVPHKIQIPEYEKLDKTHLESSIQYYTNNPDGLIPNLTLLRMANNEHTPIKLREFLDNHYIQAKSTVDSCLNVIIHGTEYLKDLNNNGLDSSAVTQNFYHDVPILTDQIQSVLDDPKLTNVKNIKLLCKQVNNFLEIAPITTLFEEYSNNYQLLEEKSDNVLGTFGESSSEADFC